MATYHIKRVYYTRDEDHKKMTEEYDVKTKNLDPWPIVDEAIAKRKTYDWNEVVVTGPYHFFSDWFKFEMKWEAGPVIVQNCKEKMSKSIIGHAYLIRNSFSPNLLDIPRFEEFVEHENHKLNITSIIPRCTSTWNWYTSSVIGMCSCGKEIKIPERYLTHSSNQTTRKVDA